ncbi:MAG: hypothetical protein AAF483_28560 [Planctomycetota bacterium]
MRSNLRLFCLGLVMAICPPTIAPPSTIHRPVWGNSQQHHWSVLDRDSCAYSQWWLD